LKRPPHNPRAFLQLIRSLFHAAGHLALWVGLYCAGAVILFAQVSGQVASAAVIGVSGLTATSVYLLDRVKLADRWLDPADQTAHPDRFAFLGEHTMRIRLLALLLGVAAMIVAATIHPVAVVLIPLASIGVVVYAGLPRHGRRGGPARDESRRRTRIKDVLLLKNAAVAASITVFVALLILLDASSSIDALVDSLQNASQTLSIATAAAVLFSLVLADAILCDIDDAASDRAHATATIPGQFGKPAAWIVAGVLHVAVAAMLLYVGGDSALVPARRLWAGLILASFVLLAIWRPVRLRDLVDARLEVLAVIASVMLAT
jgi:4-hydroxybenzoate polyprenyltransferase